jgi:hypothetical protein
MVLQQSYLIDIVVTIFDLTVLEIYTSTIFFLQVIYYFYCFIFFLFNDKRGSRSKLIYGTRN